MSHILADKTFGNQIHFEQVENSYTKLKSYCEQEKFKGWDPFDGLNSRLFSSLIGFKENRVIKLAWIQFFKRSPINFRKVLLVPKDFNNKALGLFLSGYCKEYSYNSSEAILQKIIEISNQLLNSVTPSYSGACWGYNFDWQARAFFQPKYTPTVVATSFIGNALLDAFDVLGDTKLLEAARSSCDFILNDLNKTYNDKGDFCFSYSPLDKSVVFNASLLGSKLLSRTYNYTKEEMLIYNASRSVSYCCNLQNSNGSWSYGTLPFHKWVDNFHTGFNLECLSEYAQYSSDARFDINLSKGLEYYLNNFFLENGTPKYYNDRIYPIDIHASAQLVITLHKLDRFVQYKPLIDKVLSWTIENMQDSKGYFYYQINRHLSSKIPYMRWAQAWMFYALSTYLLTFQTSDSKI